MIDYIKNIYTVCGDANIVKLIDEFRDDLNIFLSQNPIDLIIDDFKKNTNNISVSYLRQQPSGLLQIALLTNTIFIRLAENDSLEGIKILKKAFEDSISGQVSLIINKSNHQLIRLGHFLIKIADHCVKIKTDNVYILELPVGNSIPSILLKHVLESRGIYATLLTISLNRNDSKKIGITRTQLIRDKLENISLESTVLIYVDEWITGSNFNNIITILSKVKGLNFLPCAFMTSEASQADKYSRYISDHKKICEDMGIKSEELITEFP